MEGIPTFSPASRTAQVQHVSRVLTALISVCPSIAVIGPVRAAGV